MAVRLIRALIVLAALIGTLYAAVHFPPIRWRAGLVYQKLNGALPGVGWRELGARVSPEVLGLESLIGPGPEHRVQKLNYPLEQYEHWKMYSIFRGLSGCLSDLDVHFSVLKAGEIPHELHQHFAEEVLIPVGSEAEILRAGDVESREPQVDRIGPGQFVYHPSRQPHTIRGVEPGPSAYLVVRWENGGTAPERDAIPPSIFDYRAAQDANSRREGFAPTLLFEAPTTHLDKFHAHASTMYPGAGYDAHADSYDVVILLLEGTVETIGQQVSAPSVIFYSAHKPHGMRNPGDVPAKYLVFELHGCGPD